MNKRIILFLTLCTLTAACNKDQNPAPGSFIDYGYTAPSTFTGAHQMIYYDGTIFAGTDDGIWKINLTEKAWKRAGLDGKKITCLYSHPAAAGKFFAGVASQGSTDKSLYISNDAGASWLTAESPVFDSGNNRFETYYDIKARPGFPLQVFANLSGATIAVSRDGGLTWNRQNYATDSYFGIDCSISFLENNPNVIYQGAEAPLDHAWLGKYPIDHDDPVMMGPLDQIIGKNYEWSNKRPNCIETFGSNPGVLYVGMEGALSKVEGSNWKYLFKSDPVANNFPYTYIKGIWLDPANKKHIIFGGGVNGTNNSMSLYETYDEGVTIVQLKDKMGMYDPDIIDIVAAGDYPALLVRDNGNGNKLRLLVYRFN